MSVWQENKKRKKREDSKRIRNDNHIPRWLQWRSLSRYRESETLLTADSQSWMASPSSECAPHPSLLEPVVRSQSEVLSITMTKRVAFLILFSVSSLTSIVVSEKINLYLFSLFLLRSARLIITPQQESWIEEKESAFVPSHPPTRGKNDRNHKQPEQVPERIDLLQLKREWNRLTLVNGWNEF